MPSIRRFVPLVISACLLIVFCTSAQNTKPKSDQFDSAETQEASPQVSIGQVTPTTLDIGQVLVGQTSVQKRVRLANTGDSELTVSNLSITGPFALPVNKCANGVKPGTHCDVYVTLTPPGLGTQTGSLKFTDNASNSPQTVSLTGVGATTVSTVTHLTASPTSIIAGGPVTLQATVSSLGGGVVPDGDQVVFSWRGSALGTGILRNGLATITTSAFYWTGGQGDDVARAQYVGDSSFYSSTGSTQLQVYRYGVTFTLTSSPNPSIYRQPVTVTGTLTSGSPQPIGGSMFIGGLCGDIEYTVGGGVATELCKSPGKNLGTYQLYAKYSGDAYNGGDYGFSTQVINPTNTTTSLVSSKNPSKQGQMVKFSVIVTAPYAHPVPGSVTFTLGATTLGTVDLATSRASIIVPSLPVGKSTIKATYNGGGDFLGSSVSLVQVVQ